MKNIIGCRVTRDNLMLIREPPQGVSLTPECAEKRCRDGVVFLADGEFFCRSHYIAARRTGMGPGIRLNQKPQQRGECSTYSEWLNSDGTVRRFANY